jgi:hypothetical protein
MYNLYFLQNNKPFGIIGLQTNNTLFLANETFAETKQNKLYKAKFMAKKREQLTVDIPLKFNNNLIQFVSDRIIFT